MSDPTPARRTPGRLVVIPFVIAIVVTLVIGISVRLTNNDAIRIAQVKTLPTLAANVTVRCREPTMPTSELKIRGRCTDRGTLEITSESFAEGTKQVAFVVLGREHATTGLVVPGKTVEVPLEGEPTGPHLVSVVLADGDVRLAELQAELNAKPADDVRTRLVEVESHVSMLIASGLNARAERLAFQVEDGRQVH